MISWHPTAHDKKFIPGNGFLYSDISDLDRIANCISKFIWAPVVFYNGERREKRYRASNFAVLDFDGDTREITLKQAIHNVFCDYRHIIGTTKSHRLEKNGLVADRFRVVIELEKPVVDLRTYKYILRSLTEFYDSDKACKDGARFFYPCKQIVSVNHDGDLLEIPDVPEWFMKPRPLEYYETYKNMGYMPVKCEKLLNTMIEAGKRNATFYGVAKDLAKCGYDQSKIIELILSSPTYRNQIHEFEDEIKATVGSAMAALQKT